LYYFYSVCIAKIIKNETEYKKKINKEKVEKIKKIEKMETKKNK